MKISIIIPTYNEENVIERKINNTLELEYEGNIDIIIVDSNSSDNTVQIAQKFKTLKIIEEETRLGKTHALNRALKESTGEIVVITDANGYSTSKNLLIQIAQNNCFQPQIPENKQFQCNMTLRVGKPKVYFGRENGICGVMNRHWIPFLLLAVNVWHLGEA